MTGLEFANLLAQYGNAEFLCGSYDDDAVEPYRQLVETANDLRQRLMDAFAEASRPSFLDQALNEGDG